MRNYLRLQFVPIYFWYFYYVCKHRFYVGLECFKRGLYFQAIVHDIHKFHPKEFFPYAINYHGPYKRDERPQWLRNDYDNAWKHHYSTWFGKHHWLHWNGIDMPHKYVLEMIADFRGVGRSLKGYDESVEWYAENRHKMTLHENVKYKLDKEFNFNDKTNQEAQT